MIFPNDFQRNERDQEVLDIIRPEFPCVCKVSHARDIPGRRNAWHWHPLFEVAFAASGSFYLNFQGKELTVRNGTFYFINQNVVHEAWFSREPDTEIYTLLFSTDFLFGSHHSLLEQTYVMPILESTALQLYLFQADSRRHLDMADAILQIIDLFREEPTGYELLIHEQITRFWHGLFFATAALRSNDPGGITDSARIRPMLSYISEHLASPMNAEDIAAAGHMSTRECTRLFQRCIGTSPVRYLNEQRLRHAETLLLGDRYNIAEISELCGYSSASYFSRAFTKETGKSPRDFRRDSDK